MDARRDEPIKVALIGDSKRKQEFILNCTGKQGQRLLQMDFVKFGNFQIWDFIGVDCKERKGLTFMSHTYIRNTKVMIYLDPSPEQKANWEARRDEKTCIAIDFDLLNLSPKECLATIEKLVFENLLTATPALLAKNKSLIESAVSKSILVKRGQKSSNSLFSFLPNELTAQINCYQHLLAKKHSIFSTDTHIAKPIFKQLPAILFEKEEQENHKSFKKS